MTQPERPDNTEPREEERTMPLKTELLDRDYGRHYSEESFWAKLRAYARKAGRQVVHKALSLYYAAAAPTTPLWARTAILGALGYFILPLDAVPDIIPGVGFADDLGVLAVALATVAAHVTAEHTRRATETLATWFGERMTLPDQ